LALWLLSGCTPANQAPSTPFIAPTVALSPTPAVTLAPSEPQPTPLPLCQDNLTYIEDLTIPDGSAVPPNTILDKRWQVENSGSCNWDKGYHLKLTGGNALGAAEDLALYPARSHSQAVLRIEFTAPTEPGNYRSSWQAFSPDGKPFGDPVFIDIVVQ
jgi:hypothetical protein